MSVKESRISEMKFKFVYIYIYVCVCVCVCVFLAQHPPVGQGPLIHGIYLDHTQNVPKSEGLL